jgi:hypothetical protein
MTTGVVLIRLSAGKEKSALAKIKDTKGAPEASADCTQQLQRLVPKNFLAATPWPA